MAGSTLPSRERSVKRFQEEAVWSSGKFTVDDDGNVWRGNKRAEHATPLGYLQVRVMVDGVRYHTGAHRIVWRALHGPIPRGMVVNHKNGQKRDNRPENLELLTYSGNTSHAHQTGLLDQSGEKNPAAKLSDDQVKSVRILYASGEFTMKTIGDMFGVSFQQVSKIVRGERRSNQDGPVSSKDLRY